MEPQGGGHTFKTQRWLLYKFFSVEGYDGLGVLSMGGVKRKKRGGEALGKGKGEHAHTKKREKKARRKGYLLPHCLLARCGRQLSPFAIPACGTFCHYVLLAFCFCYCFQCWCSWRECQFVCKLESKELGVVMSIVQGDIATECLRPTLVYSSGWERIGIRKVT